METVNTYYVIIEITVALKTIHNFSYKGAQISEYISGFPEEILSNVCSLNVDGLVWYCFKRSSIISVLT